MSYKRGLSLFVSLLFMVLLLPQAAFCQESANCLACHSAMKGRLKTSSGELIELNVNTEKFQASVHGSLSCTDCHIRFSDNPHASPSGLVPPAILSIASEISVKYHVDPVAAAACSKCHAEIYQKTLESVHGKNITVKHQPDGAFCLDCHGSPHYVVPAKDPDSKVSRARQIQTCGKCHGNKIITEKYKLEENVMESYEESFHGRKLALGDSRAPVCSSCHGAHDIMSVTDPQSPVYGKNKLKTCGKCHRGASEKFIPAITHRPPGPIPYYAEKALIVLLLSVFTFIVLHVLLEAFSDIRDAIFRRGRHE
jgi:formate-dependent nitrite reductase cytochrome c552 subunit